MISRLVKSTFEKLGYNVTRIKTAKDANSRDLSLEFTMEAALRRCVSRGITVNTVIDVGASNGSWSLTCMKAIPSSAYLLIDANETHKTALHAFSDQHKNAQFIIAAAGAKDGRIYFDNSDPFGGLASETKADSSFIEVPVIAIDSQVASRNLKGPFLIKLDTHGFEVPILEGARETLKSTNLVIIETYNYKLTKESLKYYQMCQYMETLGFSPIENVDFVLRAYDNSFWQMDTFFIRSDSREFLHNAFD